jgi:hypothetical protein
MEPRRGTSRLAVGAVLLVLAFYATAVTADFFLDRPFLYTGREEWSNVLWRSTARFPQSAESALHLIASALLVPATVLLSTWLAHKSSADPFERVFARLGATPAKVALGLSVLATIAAALVSLGIIRGVPLLDDERAYAFQAELFAHGKLTLPPAPAALRNPMMLTEPAWMGKYPPGHPLVLAIGVLLGSPRLVPPLLAFVLTFAAFGFTREVFGEKRALLVAVLVASSPFVWCTCATLMAFPTMACAYVGGLWLFARARKSGSRAAMLGCGAVLGFGCTVRPYDGAVLVAPLVVWLFVDLVRRRPRAPAALLELAGGAVPPIAMLLWYNLRTTGAPLRFGYSIARDHSFGFGRPLPGFAYEHTPLQAVGQWVAAIIRLDLWLLGYPASMLLVLAGLVLSRDTWLRVIAWSLALFALAYALLASSGTWDVGPTYAFVIGPLLIVLAASAVASVRRSIPDGALQRFVLWLPIAGLLIGAVTVLPMRLVRLRALTEAIEAPWAFIEAADPGDAIVVVSDHRRYAAAGYSLGYPYRIATKRGVVRLIRPASIAELEEARAQLGPELPVYELRADLALLQKTGERRYELARVP